MNTITHALLPLIGISVGQGRRYWTGKKLLLVGVFGALPDILNPHLGIEARLSSWSHGLPAFLGVSLVLLILSCIKRMRLERKLAVWMAGAYLFHLFCDMISGGIAWLYPFRHSVIGDYYVPPLFWIPLDIVSLLAVYLIYRAIPRYRRAKLKAEQDTGDHSPL